MGTRLASHEKHKIVQRLIEEDGNLAELASELQIEEHILKSWKHEAILDLSEMIMSMVKNIESSKQ